MVDPSKKISALELRVAVTAHDYDLLSEFYAAGLGIDPVENWSGEDGRGTVFEMGHATLEILDERHAAAVDQIEAGRRVSGQVRLALKVVDVASAAARLVARGATLVHPPVLTPWGHLNARLQAPDGMQITLFQEQDSGAAAAEGM
jgi:predicted enzyme related to lactoylglutathione lyase